MATPAPVLAPNATQAQYTQFIANYQAWQAAGRAAAQSTQLQGQGPAPLTYSQQQAVLHGATVQQAQNPIPGASSFWGSFTRDILGAVGLAPSLFGGVGGSGSSGAAAAEAAGAGAPNFTAGEQWSGYNPPSDYPGTPANTGVSAGLLPIDIGGAGPSNNSAVSTPGGPTMGAGDVPAPSGDTPAPAPSAATPAAPGAVVEVAPNGLSLVPPSAVYGDPATPHDSIDLWGILKALLGLATPFIVPFLKSLFGPAAAPAGMGPQGGGSGGSGGAEAAGSGDLLGDAGPLGAFKRLPPLAKVAILVVLGTLGTIAARKALRKG